MKKILFILIALLPILVQAQSAAQIAKKMSDANIRAAFNGIATEAKHVTAAWTFDNIVASLTDTTLEDLVVSDSITVANLVATLMVGKYDALAYWTATQANAGGVTFNSTSDGTAGFTFSDLVTTSAGINLGTSQSLVGTTAMTIGSGAQTLYLNSSDWKIGTTGIITGVGNLTSDGDAVFTGGDFTGAAGDALDIGEAADATFTFSRNDAGVVTLTSVDTDANAALTVVAGGTGDMIVGDSNSTLALTSSDWTVGATGIITNLGNVGSDGDATFTGGDFIGANGNSVDVGEAVDGSITFGRDDAGTVTLTSVDSDANAALTVAAGGTGDLTIGDANSTTAITSSDWAFDVSGIGTGLGNMTSDGDATFTGGDFIGGNGDQLDIGEVADDQFTLTRNDVGIVTLTSADNDANADLTIGAGGTGALIVGDVGSTTTITSAGTIALTVSNVDIGATGGSETTPALAIRADADSDAEDTDEALTIDLTANTAPTSAVWDVTSTQSAGYRFDKSFTVGLATPNETVPTFSVRGDADSDAEDVTDALSIVLTPNTAPTSATWGFASTQSAGYTFDKAVSVTGLVTSSAGFVLGDTDYIGVTGNEIVTFNTAGTIVASGADFHIGGTVADQFAPALKIVGDADSDGTTTSETLTIDLAPASDPLAATWGFTSTQGAGYTFDKAVGVTGAITGTTTIAAGTSFNPDAAGGAALGTTALEFTDAFLADGGAVKFGLDQDVTLTHVADTGLLLNTTMALQFRDATEVINSSADGQLDIDATTEVEIATATLDLNGILDVSGNVNTAGDISMATTKAIKTSVTTAHTLALQYYDVNGTAYQDAILLTNGDAPALVIGSGGQQTAAINTADWDIDATGIITGAGAITSDGLIQTSGGAALYGAFNYLGASDNTKGTDTFVITPTPALAAYTTGLLVSFKADTVNTGACLVNISALGNISLKALNNQDPANDYIEASSMVVMVYDGTTFQLLEPDANP